MAWLEVMKRFDGGVSVVGGHDSEELMEERLSSGGAEAEGGLARMAKRSKAPLETSLGMCCRLLRRS